MNDLIAALRTTTQRLDAENAYLREQIDRWIADDRTSATMRAAMVLALHEVDGPDLPPLWPGVAPLDVACPTHGLQRPHAQTDRCAICAHLEQVSQ